MFIDYLKTIEQTNHLCNGSPIQWLFHPGMLFSTRAKWWGDFKIRASMHEGIDITYFKTGDQHLQQFDTRTKIPAIADGKVLNICNDFLGQTLVIQFQSNPRIIFVYAHIVPEISIRPDTIIKKGETIARVCSTRKNPQLPPHLHFSCFEVPLDLPNTTLNWDLFSKQKNIKLFNPVFL